MPARVTKQDRIEWKGFLRNATDRQLVEIYQREKSRFGGSVVYARMTEDEIKLRERTGKKVRGFGDW